MAGKSTIRRLPPEIRQTIDGLLKAGRTYDEIVAKLSELDVTVSRSALGRYGKEFKKVGENMLRAREIASVFVEKLGAAPEGNQGRLITELLQTVVFDKLVAGNSVEADDIFKLARAIRDLATSEKISAERELKIRKEVAGDAADKLAEAAKREGISAATIKKWRREVLGVAAAA